MCVCVLCVHGCALEQLCGKEMPMCCVCALFAVWSRRCKGNTLNLVITLARRDASPCGLLAVAALPGQPPVAKNLPILEPSALASASSNVAAGNWDAPPACTFYIAVTTEFHRRWVTSKVKPQNLNAPNLKCPYPTLPVCIRQLFRVFCMSASDNLWNL